MVHFSLLYKGHASEELDVILVRGGRPNGGWTPAHPELFEGDLLGVFLVSKADPALAYELTIENDLAGYVAVERAERGEITIRPFNDYGISGMRRKYFYQSSTKQLIATRDFWPKGLEHAGAENGQLVLWASLPESFM